MHGFPCGSHDGERRTFRPCTESADNPVKHLFIIDNTSTFSIKGAEHLRLLDSGALRASSIANCLLLCSDSRLISVSEE